MTHEISRLSLPELIELSKHILEEIELRAMELTESEVTNER